MFKRFTTENLYKTRLSSELAAISSTGDPLTVFTIEVEDAPANSQGWVIVDFANSVERDLIYYHSVTGSVLSYYRKDRDLLNTGAFTVTHDEGVFVQMNDVAQLINYLFANTDDFGRVEDMGDNKCRILGGFVDYGSGSVVTIADSTPEALADGTYYGVFNLATGALGFIDVASYAHGTHVLLALVTVASTDISSIVDKRYKEFFKNRPVLDDLSDSGGVLAYKGVPLNPGSTTVEKYVIVDETTGAYTANLGEYIRCKYTTDHTVISLPESNASNAGNKVAVAKKNFSGKYVQIEPAAGDTIEGFTSSSYLQIGQQNTSVTLMSNGDGSRTVV